MGQGCGPRGSCPPVWHRWVPTGVLIPQRLTPGPCGKKGLPSCLSLSWRVLGGFKPCLGEGSELFWVLLPGALMHTAAGLIPKLWELCTSSTQGWNCPSPFQCWGTAWLGWTGRALSCHHWDQELPGVPQAVWLCQLCGCALGCVVVPAPAQSPSPALQTPALLAGLVPWPCLSHVPVVPRSGTGCPQPRRPTASR